MKFKDLVFEKHPVALLNSQAVHQFPNGYGVSVIDGDYAYCDNGTYEVAITKEGELCYDTPLTDDVLRYQTPEEIDEILKEVEHYEKDQY